MLPSFVDLDDGVETNAVPAMQLGMVGRMVGGCRKYGRGPAREGARATTAKDDLTPDSMQDMLVPESESPQSH